MLTPRLRCPVNRKSMPALMSNDPKVRDAMRIERADNQSVLENP
jgi:hypothetical protein